MGDDYCQVRQNLPNIKIYELLFMEAACIEREREGGADRQTDRQTDRQITPSQPRRLHHGEEDKEEE